MTGGFGGKTLDELETLLSELLVIMTVSELEAGTSESESYSIMMSYLLDSISSIYSDEDDSGMALDDETITIGLGSSLSLFIGDGGEGSLPLLLVTGVTLDED